MADDVTYSGTGSTVPANTKQVTDEHATRGHMPVVKLAYSADGVATHVPADVDGLLVNLGANNDVTIGSLPTLPAGNNNIGDVDVASVPAPLSTTGGGTEAAALRVTIANDSTGVLSVDDNGGSITVDGPLTDAQLRASEVPVSAASLPLPSGAATLAEQQTQTTSLQLIDDAVYTDGAGTPSKAIGIAGTDGTNPQIIKTDAAGELQVDVLSSALPSGAATAANQATANTALSAIQTAVETIDSAISGNEMQVDVLTLPAIPAGTNNIGDVDVLSLPATPAGDNVIGRTKITDGTDVADVLDLTNSNPLVVAIVDGSGNQVTSFGGSGGTSATDDAAFTPGSGAGTPIMGTVTADSVDSGDVGVLGMLANRQLKVTLFDSGGSELSVGGGTQYTEDGAAASNPVGTALNLIRDDARGGSLTTTDGDNVAARGTNAGELYVKHVDSIPVTNAGLTELAGAIDTEVQCDIVGALPAGDNNIGNVDVLSSALPTGASTLPEQQSQTTHLATIAGDTTDIEAAVELIDDTVATLGTTTYTEATTKGLIIGAVRRDADTALVDTTNEVSPLQVDANGRLKVEAFSGETLPVSGNVTANAGTDLNTSALALESGGNLAGAATSLAVIDDWDESDRAKVNPIVGQAGVAAGAGAVGAAVQRMTLASDDPAVASLSVLDDWDESDRCRVNAAGSIADDSTTPNNPVMIGGTAKESDGTDPGSVSAEDDVVRAIFDRNRRQYVNDVHPNLWSVFEDHTSAQTNNQLKAAPGANLSLYITDIIFSNGATAGSIKLVEDEGGTPVQASQTVYMAINGGAVMNFRTPKRLTANKSLGFTSTSVTTHSVELHGYIAP